MRRSGIQSFSPLEVGKQWFYTEIEKRWKLLTLHGYDTKEIRDRLGLKKSSNKLSETFKAHCVDSWCLAYYTVGGSDTPENTDIFCIAPIPIVDVNSTDRTHRKMEKTKIWWDDVERTGKEYPR